MHAIGECGALVTIYKGVLFAGLCLRLRRGEGKATEVTSTGSYSSWKRHCGESEKVPSLSAIPE
jgi:hypothetical protein